MLVALQSCSPHCDTQYWCFGLVRKAFVSNIFCIIKVYPWSEINLDAHYNLYSFCYWALQSCSAHWETRNYCFAFARKAFYSNIFTIINVHWRNDTNLHIHYNLYFVRYCTEIMLYPLGYTILMLWICKKSFSFHHFSYN